MEAYIYKVFDKQADHWLYTVITAKSEERADKIASNYSDGSEYQKLGKVAMWKEGTNFVGYNWKDKFVWVS